MEFSAKFLIFVCCLGVLRAQWGPPQNTQISGKVRINPRPATQTTNMGVISPGMPMQNVDVWKALDDMRGHQSLRSDEITEFLLSATPGVDYPALSTIPENPFFNCRAVNQPGFYADPTAKCQVFRRCDQDGNLFSYLCPNTTIFNQITLTCDYFYNVDCSKASAYYDYSNSRLYHEGWPLLGNLYTR